MHWTLVFGCRLSASICLDSLYTSDPLWDAAPRGWRSLAQPERCTSRLHLHILEVDSFNCTSRVSLDHDHLTEVEGVIDGSTIHAAACICCMCSRKQFFRNLKWPDNSQRFHIRDLGQSNACAGQAPSQGPVMHPFPLPGFTRATVSVYFRSVAHP